MPRTQTIRTEDDDRMRRANKDRVRRALSWLKKSRKAHSDVERFLYLWISFNAAYGHTTENGRSDTENGDGSCEANMQRNFLLKICNQDGRKRLHEVVRDKECVKAIHDVMNNKFIYEGYWTCVRAQKAVFDSRERFRDENKSVKRHTTPGLLSPRDALPIVFQRLYTLRNQIVHGGVTARNGWGRKQLRAGSRAMEKVIPVVLKIMKTHIDKDPPSNAWGDLRYPRHEPPLE
ncbi:MAG: HEPN domain-containing protein [Acidobacteria bacterium]|nr:HEPN domain-containing protein [Acidobacteriota bacterium]